MTEESNTRGTILPEPGERNILITSALPYVNNVPHLGNIIGSVLSGDAYARYCRGCGVNTLYVGGTDEYGTTTEAKALVENCTPQELCDKYHVIHAEIYQWFNIDFDVFGRTTAQFHTDIAQDIFLKIKHHGLLQERTTAQLYCEEHRSFLADRFVEGECPKCAYTEARGDQCDHCGQLVEHLGLKNPRCKIDGSTPIAKETRHIFLELDKLQPEIDAFFRQSAGKGAWSSNGQRITSSWLREGLQPRSITRDIRWGVKVPVPGYEEKVIYSWFDACIGYISITAQHTDQWEKWWHSEDVQLYQFIGKDNVVFHSVMFPGTQIATGETWTKLHHLSTTDYLTYEGGKFSKSRGVGVFGDSARETGVASDVWRYYLLAHRPETSDSEFTWDAFIHANNSSLVNNLGNFVNRVLKFVNSHHYNNIVPDWTQHGRDTSHEAWKGEINGLLAEYIRDLDAVKLRPALVIVLRISALGNTFLQSNKLSYTLIAQDPARCAAVIALTVNLVHLLAAIAAPYLPDSARAINEQLRTEPLPIPDCWTADSVKPGHEIGKAEHLFCRIKPEKAEEWRKAFGSN